MGERSRYVPALDSISMVSLKTIVLTPGGFDFVFFLARLLPSAFWTFYVSIVFASWLCLSCVVRVGMAWTYVNIIHNAVSAASKHVSNVSDSKQREHEEAHLDF